MAGTRFFSAFDGVHGQELWKSDGTGPGTLMVKDIYSYEPSEGSLPGPMANVGGTLFLSADDGQTGRELWKSDGTSGGTMLVKDIYPGLNVAGLPAGSNPGELTNLAGTLLFVAIDPTHSDALWTSDGTDPGTVLMKDIHGNPGALTNVAGTLFFVDNGCQLWVSDGTADGTVMVHGINPSGCSEPWFLTRVRATLFFGAFDGVTRGLWKASA